MGRDWDPTGWLLMGTLLYLWLSVSLLLGRFCSRWIGSRAGARKNWLELIFVGLHHAIALAPALWIVAAAALVARAFVSGGEWPGPEHCDYFRGERPSHVAARAFGLYYDVAEFALLAMVLSSFAFPTLHSAAHRLVGRRKTWFASWIVTLLVGLATLLYDGRYAIADWFQ